MNNRSYLLKIQLVGIEPAIWRRLVAPAGITLDRLHDVIRTAATAAYLNQSLQPTAQPLRGFASADL